MINGVTEILITKADVLDDMPNINVCTAYKVDGETTQEFLFDIQHRDIEPVYTTLPVWETPLAQCKTAADLPPTFMALTQLITSVTGVPVSCVSNGVGRDALIAL
jgi:adenylosuccinate synthase